MNILHITSILPAPLKRKKTENDILIRIAEKYQNQYTGSRHHFILCLPYSNSLLAGFQNRWKEYHELIKKGFYEYNGFNIFVIGMPAFASDQIIRKQLSRIGYLLNKDRMETILDKVEPNVIHAHNFRGNIELAEIIKKHYGFDYVATARNVNKKVLTRIKNKKLTPSKILTINYKAYHKCKQHLTTPVELIPHPVDDDFFINPDEISINEKLKFISICRLLDWKYVDRVILALSKIDSSFVYDIYGSGPEDKKLKQMVDDLNLHDKVNFKGWVKHEKIKKVMKKYDLFLQPSYPETLGRVYFEAMASGVPVLAAKNTGVDGVIKNEREGFLVNHEEVASIYNAINNFVNIPEKKIKELKENAINTANLYLWNNTLVEYRKFYEKGCL